jgi:hypothetical protein
VPPASSKAAEISLQAEHPRSDSKTAAIEGGTHFLTTGFTLEVIGNVNAGVVSTVSIEAVADVAIAIVRAACLA